MIKEFEEQRNLIVRMLQYRYSQAEVCRHLQLLYHDEVHLPSLRKYLLAFGIHAAPGLPTVKKISAMRACKDLRQIIYDHPEPSLLSMESFWEHAVSLQTDRCKGFCVTDTEMNFFFAGFRLMTDEQLGCRLQDCKLFKNNYASHKIYLKGRSCENP